MEELAEVYARSLFEVAEEHDVLDEIHDELGEFADVLAENRELQIFFFSPYFSSEEKKDAIGKVVEGANEYFQRFLELLAERHRLPVLMRIRRDFDEHYAEARKLLSVTVAAAVELDDSLVKEIDDKIQEQTGRRVELSAKVEPDLIGGLVLRVGNMVLDASIRARLERLRKQVAQAA